jgi:branched-chain amino acid aminotransferase
MTEELVYLNGSLVPRAEARVSVFDHAFLYGYGLFETMRAYHGKIFLLERHIDRLADGAEAIGLATLLKGIDLARACRDTLQANNLNEARVRLTVTGGESEAFPWEGKRGGPTVVVTARPYTAFPAEKLLQGFRVGVASLRRGAPLNVSGIKSVNYLVNVLARMEAARYGLDESLLLNDRGYIAEGANSNVFFVRGPGLVTPSTGSGILPGITRGLVMEMAGTLGIGVAESDTALTDLKTFDEAFMTSSVIEVMPLVAVRDEDGHMISIGTGRPGEVTLKLMAAYKARVEQETGERL